VVVVVVAVPVSIPPPAVILDKLIVVFSLKAQDKEMST
jgi:hypothetical protein